MAERNVRLTISMPVTTFNLLEEVSERSKRSRIITEAVERYAQELKNRRLCERLKEGYLARADRDKAIALEWADVEEEAILRNNDKAAVKNVNKKRS